MADLSCELGRRRMQLGEIAGLQVRDIVVLDKLPGARCQLLLDGRPFALAEVVVQADGLAARLTETLPLPDGSILAAPVAPATPQNAQNLAAAWADLSVEIGRTTMACKDAAELRRGAPVALGKQPGDDAEILLNRTPIAQGQVVSTKEGFGVRITSILGSG